ncbi:MAG: metallophosphoesterase family protein [Streptosporangiaceae bacterium]
MTLPWAGDAPDPAPSRLLAAGDWHGNRDWAISVIKRVPQLLRDEQTKLLLHLGDFGIWPGIEGRRYLDAVSAALGLVNAQLWFIDGNHEDFPQLARMASATRPDGRVEVRPNIFHLPRGHRWMWHGLTWLSCGGGVSLDRAARAEGIDWWPQEEITSGQETALIASGPADVMVCHDCPAGVAHDFPRPPSWWSAADMARSDSHRERLQRIVNAVRPAHLMHGHLHKAYQRSCDFGYGPVRVTGLAADGSLRNFAVLDVELVTWKLRSRGLLDVGRRR